MEDSSDTRVQIKYSSSGFFRSLTKKPSEIMSFFGVKGFFRLVTYLLPMVGS